MKRKLKRDLSMFLSLVSSAYVFGATAAETDYSWKFDTTARPALIVESVSASKPVLQVWPSWIEAYCEGGIFRHGLLLFFR